MVRLGLGGSHRLSTRLPIRIAVLRTGVGRESCGAGTMGPVELLRW